MGMINEIKAAVEQAKDEKWTDECFRDHFPFVRDCEYLLSELAAAQKHANDLGDLLAKVEQEREATTLARIEQARAAARAGDWLDTDCEEVVLAILEGDTE